MPLHLFKLIDKMKNWFINARTDDSLFQGDNIFMCNLLFKASQRVQLQTHFKTYDHLQLNTNGICKCAHDLLCLVKHFHVPPKTCKILHRRRSGNIFSTLFLSLTTFPKVVTLVQKTLHRLHSFYAVESSCDHRCLRLENESQRFPMRRNNPLCYQYHTNAQGRGINGQYHFLKLISKYNQRCKKMPRKVVVVVTLFNEGNT